LAVFVLRISKGSGGADRGHLLFSIAGERNGGDTAAAENLVEGGRRGQETRCVRNEIHSIRLVAGAGGRSDYTNQDFQGLAKLPIPVVFGQHLDTVTGIRRFLSLHCAVNRLSSSRGDGAFGAALETGNRRK